MQSQGSTIIYPPGYNYWNSNFLGTIGHVDCLSGLISLIVPMLFCGFVLLQSKWRFLCLSALPLLFYAQIFSDVDCGKIGMATALLIALPFLLEDRERISRSMLGFAVLSAVFSLHKLFSVERGGGINIVPGKMFFISLIVAILLAGGSILLERADGLQLPSPRKMRRIVVTVLLVFIIVGLVFIYCYSGSNRLLQEMSQVLHGVLTDEAGTQRGYIWKKSFILIREMPLTGSGPGTFFARFAPYNAGYQVYYPDTVVDFAHNDFLQIGVCQGLVGLLLYLAFIVILAIRALKTAAYRPEIVILASGAAGYLAYSFFVFSIAIITPLFWVTAGLIDYQCRFQPLLKPVDDTTQGKRP